VSPYAICRRRRFSIAICALLPTRAAFRSALPRGHFGCCAAKIAPVRMISRLATNGRWKRNSPPRGHPYGVPACSCMSLSKRTFRATISARRSRCARAPGTLVRARACSDVPGGTSQTAPRAAPLRPFRSSFELFPRYTRLQSELPSFTCPWLRDDSRPLRQTVGPATSTVSRLI